jgi:helix-turn-helix protein
MSSANFNRTGPMAGPMHTNGGATARAIYPVDAPGETAVDPAELMPRSRETLESGPCVPIRQESSVELIRGAKSAGPAYDRLLTPEQVAERLNVSPDWVRDHSSRKSPRLPVIRLGGGPGRAGLLRYRASEIERFIEEMARLSERRLRAV